MIREDILIFCPSFRALALLLPCRFHVKTDVVGILYPGGAMYDRFKWLVGNFSAVDVSKCPVSDIPPL